MKPFLRSALGILGLWFFPFSLTIYAVNVAVCCEPLNYLLQCKVSGLWTNKEQNSNKQKTKKLTVSSSKAKDPKFYSPLSLSLHLSLTPLTPKFSPIPCPRKFHSDALRSGSACLSLHPYSLLEHSIACLRVENESCASIVCKPMRVDYRMCRKMQTWTSCYLELKTLANPTEHLNKLLVSHLFKSRLVAWKCSRIPSRHPTLRQNNTIRSPMFYFLRSSSVYVTIYA